jgi:hypothetical protein
MEEQKGKYFATSSTESSKKSIDMVEQRSTQGKLRS